MEAYVHIRTEPGKETSIARQLRELPEVRQADVVTGNFDVITRVEGREPQELLRSISEHLRPIKGVLRTETSLVLEQASSERPSRK
ncbi:Lrp/AsnC ligand binding domain-containing protein [Candidatus Woesearchaeota archaeon]|nr:Lrp/AsnC ligand binding domain-containing protein [Candidatus Woesearchaeota archaeon]